ncbi:histidinol phosphate phosphatase, partial [Pandoraea pneumonica]
WLGAAGQPTTLNGRAVRTRACATLEGALLATTSPHAFSGEEADAFLALVAAVSGGHARQGPVYGGDCYNYGLVAAGHLDLVCE